MHEVKFSIPERELGKSDIEFKVKKDGKLFGTLRVSKGALVWIPKDTIYGHKMSWTEFDSAMKTKRKAERR